MAEKYPFNKIEPKWQKFWEKEKLFYVDTKTPKDKYYVLVMFPYPSGDLHVGHGRNYIIGDAVARYKLMRGFNVLTPMGWDAFGLPAENAAIKSNTHPRNWTLKNIKRMKQQLHQWGCCYDWKREVTSCLPDYYKWTQWIFLKLFERGLAYKKLASVNWCSHCKTVLANEQVVAGTCERCQSDVIEKDLEQWFFKITDYAQRLLDDLSLLEKWPQRVRIMQKNWIGKSEGVEIDFPIEGGNDKLSCFTTRVDTIFGATYMAIACEHPRIHELIKNSKNKDEILEFIHRVKNQPKSERESEEIKKEGIFTGRYLINPVNNEKIPLWITNYVLLAYGTGAVMAVPAHDQRDFEFAKEYNLPIKIVIQNPDAKNQKAKDLKEAYINNGIMVNSSQFDGIDNQEAMGKIADWMESKKIGRCAVSYRLRDWLISRQRYWGAPIPIVYCEKCGVVAVPEEDLPVLLPEKIAFKPTGESPLKDVKNFLNTKCPKCKNKAKREIDTMDTFVDSSWYYLRYISPKLKEAVFDSQFVNEWLPIDQYIGGVEHAILNLLYSRFITKVFHDMNLVAFSEPFGRLFTQGMIVKDGAKMSKSKGNVVSPDELISKFGTDTVRLYTLFIGPPEKDAEWNDRGVEGAWRFLNRVWRITEEIKNLKGKIDNSKVSSSERKFQALRQKTHLTIKNVTDDIEHNFHFNTAIAFIMELVNAMYAASNDIETEEDYQITRDAIDTVVVLLAPFAPHVSEELWLRLGNKPSVFQQPWPKCIKEFIKQETVTMVIQVNGKLRSKIDVPTNIEQEKIKELVLSDEKVKKFLGEKSIKKFIVVPKKIVNIVI